MEFGPREVTPWASDAAGSGQSAEPLLMGSDHGAPWERGPLKPERPSFTPGVAPRDAGVGHDEPRGAPSGLAPSAHRLRRRTPPAGIAARANGVATAPLEQQSDTRTKAAGAFEPPGDARGSWGASDARNDQAAKETSNGTRGERGQRD